MDANAALWWLGVIGGAIALLRGVVGLRSRDIVGFVKGLVVASATGLAYFLAPSVDGYVAFGAWAVLVLSPTLVSRALSDAIARQKHARARRLATLLRAIHPTEGVKLLLLDLHAGDRMRAGDEAGAAAIYAEAAKLGPAAAEWAGMTRLRLAADWQGIIDRYEGRLGELDRARRPAHLQSYLRALGEVGRRRDLLAELTRAAPMMSGIANAELRASSWLFAFAFAGRRDLVDRLFAGPLASYGDQVKGFWRGTADLAAHRENAEAELAALRAGADPSMRRAIDRRLAGAALLPTEPLSIEENAVLATAATALGQEERFGLTMKRSSPVAVVVLVILNVAVFAIDRIAPELGIFDGWSFYEPQVAAGDWWRPLTCTFLHIDHVHLGMNMVGLWVLGPYVEHVLGRARFVAMYIAAGLGGSFALFMVAYLGIRPPDVAIGASGSIMGVVGATLAIALRGYVKERAPLARSRLALLAVLVVLQSAIDISTPQISFTAHAGGLVTGFLVALVMKQHR